MGSNAIDFKSKKTNPNIPSVQDISVQDLRDHQAQVHIIDVRRPDEWTGEFGHIAEAEHLVLDLLPQKVKDLPQNKTIVFVCRSGARSAQASAFAKQSGYENVFNLAGGMMAWTQAGLPVVEQNANR